MMYLKYPEPELQTVVHPGGVVFFLQIGRAHV